MSLSQEERDIMVGLELDKADSTFAPTKGKKARRLVSASLS